MPHDFKSIPNLPTERPRGIQRVVPPAEGAVLVYNSPIVRSVPRTTLYNQRKGQLKQKLQVLKLQANGSTRGQLLLTSADNATCLKRRHVVTVAMLADMD